MIAEDYEDDFHQEDNNQQEAAKEASNEGHKAAIMLDRMRMRKSMSAPKPLAQPRFQPAHTASMDNAIPP